MAMNGNNFSNVLFVASIALASVRAYAQPDLQQCALIKDGAVRLDCYDKLVQGMTATFELKKAHWPTSDESGEIANTGGTVTIALHTPSTGWTITFDNGQSWKQIGTAGFVVKTGDTCAISPGMINTFLLQCGSRARRIQVTPAQ